MQVYKDLMVSQEQELEALRTQMTQRNQQDVSLIEQLRDSNDRLQVCEAPLRNAVSVSMVFASLTSSYHFRLLSLGRVFSHWDPLCVFILITTSLYKHNIF